MKKEIEVLCCWKQFTIILLGSGRKKVGIAFMGSHKRMINAYGHTTLKARHPVRSVKLSNVGPG